MGSCSEGSTALWHHHIYSCRSARYNSSCTHQQISSVSVVRWYLPWPTVAASTAVLSPAWTCIYIYPPHRSVSSVYAGFLSRSISFELHSVVSQKVTIEADYAESISVQHIVTVVQNMFCVALRTPPVMQGQAFTLTYVGFSHYAPTRERCCAFCRISSPHNSYSLTGKIRAFPPNCGGYVACQHPCSIPN